MMNDYWRTTLRTIALSLIIGGASGVLTAALTSSYLSDYAIQLSEITAPLRVVDERPKAFPNSYIEAVQNFEDNTLKSVVTFYANSGKGIYGFDAADKVASGALLTSDGWIAVAGTSTNTLLASSVQAKDKIYDVEQVVFDNVTKTTFVKIDANSLPVVSFGSGLDVDLGEQLFASSGAGSFTSTTVLKQKWPKGIVVSSDKPSRRIVIKENTVELGSPIFDLSGMLVGFYVKEGTLKQMIPVDGILPSLNALLKEKKIQRPTLGVQYIDISHSVGLSEKTTRGNRYGAYLTGRPAVRAGSAAAKADVRAGDIILSINGQNVNGHRGLDEIIFSYSPKDEIELVIDRKGEEITKKVTLLN